MARETDPASRGAVAAEPPEAPSGRDAVVRAIDQLIDECRAECLWYFRPDYHPTTDLERMRVLDAIQERSGNEVFQRAGVLKAWLSRNSSDASASS